MRTRLSCFQKGLPNHFPLKTNQFLFSFFSNKVSSSKKPVVKFRTEFDRKWASDKKSLVQSSSKLTGVEFANLLKKLTENRSNEAQKILESPVAFSFFDSIPERLPKMATEDFLGLLEALSSSQRLASAAPSLPKLWALLESEATKRIYLSNIDQLTVVLKSFAAAGRGSADFYAKMEDIILDNREEIAAHTAPSKILDHILWAFSTTNTGSTTFYAELSFTIENLVKRVGGGRATLINPVHMSQIVNYYSKTTASIQGAFKLYALTETVVERNLNKMELNELVRIVENLFPQKIGKNSFLKLIEKKLVNLLRTRDDDFQHIVFPEKAKNVISIPDCISLFKSMCTHRFNEPDLLLILMRKIARNAQSLTTGQLETVLWAFVRGRLRGELYNALEKEFLSRIRLIKPRGLAFSFENFMVYGRISAELFEKFLPEIEANLAKMDIHYKLKVVNGLYHAYYLTKLQKSKEKCESLAAEIIKDICSTARFFQHEKSPGSLSKMKYKDILRFLGLLAEHPIHVRTQKEIPVLIEAIESHLNILFDKAYANSENIPIRTTKNIEGDQFRTLLNSENDFEEGILRGEIDGAGEEEEDDQVHEKSDGDEEVEQNLKQSRMKVDFIDLCTVYNLFVRLNMGSEVFIEKLESTITRSVVRVPKHLFCETMYSLIERNKHAHLVKFYPVIQELTRYGEVKQFFNHESYCLMLYSLVTNELIHQGNVRYESVIQMKERVCTLLQMNFKEIVEDLLDMSCRAFSPSLLRVYLSTLLIYSNYSEVNHWEEIMRKVQEELSEEIEAQNHSQEEGKKETQTQGSSNPLRELLLRNDSSILTDPEFITRVGQLFESELLAAGILKKDQFLRNYRVLDQFLHGIDATWMTTVANEPSVRIALIVLNDSMRVKSSAKESFSAGNVSAMGHLRSAKTKLFLLKHVLGWQVYVVDSVYCRNEPENAREYLRNAIASRMSAEDYEDDENDVDVLGNARGRRTSRVRKLKVQRTSSK